MAYDDNPADQATGVWENYVAVPSTTTSVGNTGLVTGAAYVAFAVSDLDDLTEAQSVAASGSCKQILYALMTEAFDWYNGLASASAPEKLTMAQNSFSDPSSGTSMITRTEMTTYHAATATVTAE